MRPRLLFIPVLAIALFFVSLANAQFDTATVLGTVKDPSGASVVNSKVTLENVRTGVANIVKTNEFQNPTVLRTRFPRTACARRRWATLPRCSIRN